MPNSLTFTRQPDGTFQQSGQLPTSRRVRIDMDGQEGIHAYPRAKALKLVTDAIASGHVTHDEYAIVSFDTEHPDSQAPPPLATMDKFLVVSYDPDEQQWFYDLIAAEDAEAAKTTVLVVRDYAIDADALKVSDVQRLRDAIEFKNVEQIASEWEKGKQQF